VPHPQCGRHVPEEYLDRSSSNSHNGLRPPISGRAYEEAPGCVFSGASICSAKRNGQLRATATQIAVAMAEQRSFAELQSGWQAGHRGSQRPPTHRHHPLGDCKGKFAEAKGCSLFPPDTRPTIFSSPTSTATESLTWRLPSMNKVPHRPLVVDRRRLPPRARLRRLRVTIRTPRRPPPESSMATARLNLVDSESGR